MNRRIVTLALLSLVPACSSGGGSDRPASQPASAQPPDVAIAWFDLLYDAIRDEALSPPVASRTIGYASVAAYEAAVPGMKEHLSLVGQLNDLDALPDLAAGQHHWPAVVNAAVAGVLEGLFAGASAPTLQAIADLEAQQLAGFAGVSQATLDRSVLRGEDLAAAVLAWASTDGFALWNNCAYTPPVGEGLWEPTPTAFAPPLQPCWGKLRPFVLLFGAECSVLAPPSYTPDTASAYYAEAFEVYDTVNNLTPEQLAIAQFWADNPGQTGTPPGHWISIVGQVLAQEGLSLEDAAEAYVRVGLAVADAFISCWDMKYHYNYLRPITFIRDPAGINDAAWTTAAGVGTPPFPEYTSGHSVQSGAAAQVLDDLWGAVAFVDNTHDGLHPERSFTGFFEAAQEAAISRLYGGIHYRAAIDRGVEQGRCVGETILDEVSFRKP